ncbi:RING-type E3 ubiquitin transferase [Salvia divinorum]|uniref:RING-type E3 ubiquitin transferase n=1 Tax=Salvia divinorum TaxID=28513 RepID=A0ABD1FVF9_SALDI
MSAPPPPATIFYGGASVITQMPQLPPPYTDTSSPSSSDEVPTKSIVLIIIIIASALVISASIYLLLHLLSKRIHHTSSDDDDDVVQRRDSSSQPQCHAPPPANGLLDSLPLFTFRSVTGNLTGGGDCAVCLSKFEPHDQLRLLPICCHAFHADCIDAWIVSNQTCPLCRSTVIATDSELLDKILNPNRGINSGNFRDGNGNSGSFRIEIGSISRGGGRGAPEAAERERRSYSIGSFDYIVDDNGYEVSAGSVTHRRGASDCISVDKDSSVGIPMVEPPGELLAADVSSGRNWLRDYMDRLASASFRSSGRFFSGSSRRSDPVAAGAVVDDLEANRAGEEISELFRWLSGI